MVKALEGIALRVRLVEATTGKDAADHLSAGLSLDELVPISTPPEIVTLAKSGPTEGVDVAGDHLNAERFLGEHGENVRYAPELGRWFVWGGSWWGEDQLDAVHDLARQTIDGLRTWVGEAVSESDLKRRAKHYSDSARAGRLDGMLTIARSPRAIVASVARLDGHPHLLACRNGTVDLRTGELLPAEREHLITRGVDVNYDPEATSPEWLAFLTTIFNGDVEMIAYVRRLLGYSLTGEVGEHIMPTFYGKGANGKSQLLAAVMAVAGDHAAVAPEGLLVESKHEQHPERLAMLHGRRLVVSSELENRAVLAESLVKQLSGGDRISARYLYGPRFDFTPSHTLILVTNHLPRVRGTDEAIWRRLRVVPFTVTIPPADRIPDYGRLLSDLHGQAILTWLVNGAVDWYRTGLGDAEQVRQATLDYRAHEDMFGHFLEERTVEIRGRTAVKDLRAVWVDWARAANVGVGRDQDFVDWLIAHGIEVDRGRTSFARRVGLLGNPGPEQEDCTPRHPSPHNFPLRERMGEFTDEGCSGVHVGSSDTLSEPELPLDDDTPQPAPDITPELLAAKAKARERTALLRASIPIAQATAPASEPEPPTSTRARQPARPAARKRARTRSKGGRR